MSQTRITSMAGAIFEFYNAPDNVFPQRGHKVTPRSVLKDAMCQMKPGDVIKFATKKRKNAVGLQNAVSGIATVGMELPFGTFRTRVLQDAETGEWLLYVQRNSEVTEV